MSKDNYYRDGVASNNEDEYRYFFESVNTTDDSKVIKAIEYSYIEDEHEGNKVYNLGFGDYNEELDDIIDNVTTNNGDTYKVFNTVLNSIPTFFTKYDNSVISVSGSDSTDEFVNECRETCKKIEKACKLDCRKRNQRINAYCGYINKHYGELNQSYSFKGGKFCDKTQKTILEDYKVGQEYITVLVICKK
jgi:hypothetical protein